MPPDSDPAAAHAPGGAALSEPAVTNDEPAVANGALEPEAAMDAAHGAETPAAELDRALSELGAAALGFARMSPRDKTSLLRSMLPGLLAAARPMVEASCAEKRLDPGSAASGEAWLSGPCVTLAHARLLAEALEDIAARGRPRLGRGAVRVRADGRVEVDVFPARLRDAVLHGPLRARALMQPGATRAGVLEGQAPFYQQRDPDGGVALVLGAGDAASVPLRDALHKLFVDGRVVALKMSPRNAYLGPILERALAPLVSRGLLRVVYGGADVGAYLAGHPAVSEVHITGSAAAHDALVWGPPGPLAARRRASGEPLLGKPITSALGNVGPVLVMPWLYGEDELWFQARGLASQIASSTSLGRDAARVLVLPRGFAQRSLLLRMLRRALAGAPPRRAGHPGAEAQRAALLGGRPPLADTHLEGSADAPLPRGAARLGAPGPGELPWTLVTGLTEADADEPLFSTESPCGLVPIVEVGSSDPAEFLSAATRFCNERLRGTLSATLVAHPASEQDPAVEAALDRALLELRYGVIAVNHAPAAAHAVVVPPWGGHPSATLADIQSGLGFVHNTAMLGQVEKAILRAPLTTFPRPPSFRDHRRAHVVGERLSACAARPGWGAVARVIAAALRG
ncbi:aldehyde dehydrogenase [Sorangium cellulosum]|uniref:Aldehyde dehydrogenase n=1 Tax=Sorangium cellulosum TaxID=56 RepID=A0A4P2Q8C3_SORCE|nr:hypothetical protein [Sorangium cellulosum]AUX25293.1 aldehyde dehydrogenase [Sorangium cellulosum]